MACPLCGERCTCSFAGGTRVSAPHSLTYEYEDGDSPTLDREQVANEVELIGATACRSDAERSAAEQSAFPPSLSDRPPAPPEDIVLDSPPAATPDDMWKQEVADRLQSYRARRGTRRPRYNGTLSLDFDRATNRMLNSALAEEAAADEAANQFFGASIADIPVHDPPPSASDDELAPGPEEPRPEGRPQKAETHASKIIEFPRLPTLFDSVPSDLADPVLDKPRILYVPEEVPTAEAPLADIQLVHDEAPPACDLDLPLSVAPMGQRFFAGLTDMALVVTAAFVFLAIVFRDVPAPDSRAGYALVAILPAILWAIYQYLFLVYSAATPGMRMAHLELASFDSEWIRSRTRRARAIACILSAFPLGMGIVWALLDDDTLCWHDRISRTYLVLSDPEP